MKSGGINIITFEDILGTYVDEINDKSHGTEPYLFP